MIWDFLTALGWAITYITLILIGFYLFCVAVYILTNVVAVAWYRTRNNVIQDLEKARHEEKIRRKTEC